MCHGESSAIQESVYTVVLAGSGARTYKFYELMGFPLFNVLRFVNSNICDKY